MAVKHKFFKRGSFVVGDGERTEVWEDSRLGRTPLSSQYPSLYNIMRYKHGTVAHVLYH
jgi:hypothetical protein